MKKVYTHENRLLVFNAKNLLAENGIDCRIRNEFAAGGVGDLAPFETWPELWVVDEQDLQLAERLVESLTTDDPGDDIRCPHCQEMNGASFKICWHCGKTLDSAH